MHKKKNKTLLIGKSIALLACVLFLVFTMMSVNVKEQAEVRIYGIESYKLPIYPKKSGHIISNENEIFCTQDLEFVNGLLNKLKSLKPVTGETDFFSCRTVFLFEDEGKITTVQIGTNCLVKIDGKFYEYDFSINSFITDYALSNKDKLRKVLPDSGQCSSTAIDFPR